MPLFHKVLLNAFPMNSTARRGRGNEKSQVSDEFTYVESVPNTDSRGHGIRQDSRDSCESRETRQTSRHTVASLNDYTYLFTSNPWIFCLLEESLSSRKRNKQLDVDASCR